jgi:hypothetical protein
MKRTLRGSVVVALGLVVAVLAFTVVPSDAQRGGGGGGGSRGGGSMGGSMSGGGGGWRGGGGGGGNWQGGGGNWRGGNWNGGGNWRGGNWHGGSWNGGWRGANWGWRGGGWGWRGGWGWWGPGVVVGAGFAPYYWGGYPWYPYGYGYGYPYGYPPYSAPVVLDSGAQTYIEQAAPAPLEPQQQFWYYCQNPQGYYPYVGECPGGWQPVPAQPAQPR